MASLPHRLDRTVLIRARRETVFRFFTDTPRWASWWGAGSFIDARPGGALLIRYPDGTEAAGKVIDVVPPDRIAFTYGYVKGAPIPPGASLVTIRLESEEDGTRVHLVHEFAEAAVRDDHLQGWRYQLSVFGNVVSDEVMADAGAVVDAWFEAWADPDAERREQALARITTDAIRFRDRYSSIEGRAELLPHISASQRFMPGMRLTRAGDVRQCQGTVLADWLARGSDGQERMRGSNVFVFGSDGRIESVTGFINVTR